jgi:hypothetical protein
MPANEQGNQFFGPHIGTHCKVSRSQHLSKTGCAWSRLGYCRVAMFRGRDLWPRSSGYLLSRAPPRRYRLTCAALRALRYGPHRSVLAPLRFAHSFVLNELRQNPRTAVSHLREGSWPYSQLDDFIVRLDDARVLVLAVASCGRYLSKKDRGSVRKRDERTIAGKEEIQCKEYLLYKHLRMQGNNGQTAAAPPSA